MFFSFTRYFIVTWTWETFWSHQMVSSRYFPEHFFCLNWCLLKVTDYGKGIESGYGSTDCGAVFFKAPEIQVVEKHHLSNTADVWSFGLILGFLCCPEKVLEFKDKKFPPLSFIPETVEQPDIYTIPLRSFENLISPRGNMIPLIRNSEPSLLPLCEKCLNLIPTERPQFIEVIEDLFLIFSNSGWEYSLKDEERIKFMDTLKSL